MVAKEEDDNKIQLDGEIKTRIKVYLNEHKKLISNINKLQSEYKLSRLKMWQELHERFPKVDVYSKACFIEEDGPEVFLHIDDSTDVTFGNDFSPFT